LVIKPFILLISLKIKNSKIKKIRIKEDANEMLKQTTKATIVIAFTKDKKAVVTTAIKKDKTTATVLEFNII
jgi:hypothetical protein